ncbi:hypothetical protein KY290_029062 [Solanum tuberosum]|uniref:Uncharacterized protein n=1 Tax=Solanum tuberosum TaxID=4113 RepID=A0ABQ7UMX6_SOLTU|nr:hypothetical protein KY290_029062 [Solanum tuberosum]
MGSVSGCVGCFRWRTVENSGWWFGDGIWWCWAGGSELEAHAGLGFGAGFWLSSGGVFWLCWLENRGGFGVGSGSVRQCMDGCSWSLFGCWKTRAKGQEEMKVEVVLVGRSFTGKYGVF